MSDNIDRADGFGAQAQNVPREENPYIQKALDWDKGWCDRKIQELRHRLESDKIENIGTLEIGIVRTSRSER